jgi:hypothetical protein
MFISDHFLGDMSLWPNSTDLVIGAETDISTYPSNPNATLLESDLVYVQLLLHLYFVHDADLSPKRAYTPKD